MKSDILAAIDIGSNAVRLLINNVEIRGNEYDFKKIAYLRVPIRLGEDVFTRRRVSALKAGRLLAAMQGFSHIMRAYAVCGFRACATSAMRDAANGLALAKAIRKKSGIDIEIVSGRQEAELIYLASALQTLENERCCLYVDVGGGSTELVIYAERRIQFHDSFQIGTVRMLGNAVEEAEKLRFTRCLEKIGRQYTPEDIVASGGNINKTHKILGKKSNESILPNEIEALCAELKALDIEERGRVFGLKDYRADVIVPALEIFIHICGQCPSIRNIAVPKVGLADGLIRDMHKKRLLERKL